MTLKLLAISTRPVDAKLRHYVESETPVNRLEAAVRRRSSKQVFLKISKYLQQNICVGVFFNKVANLKAYSFIKNRLQHRCFL